MVLRLVSAHFSGFFLSREAVARTLPLLQTGVHWTVLLRALVGAEPGPLADAKQRSHAYDPLHVRSKAAIGNARARGLFGTSRHEERCREIMQTWFGRPFVSVRPDFLRWRTGRNLELDLYNDELRLAVEYDGAMHRTFQPAFHRTFADFRYQQEKDKWKTERCREVGITLIRVPDTVPFDRLGPYLATELKRHGVSVDPDLA